MARRGTRRVFVVPSVARLSIRAVSRRETGILFAIDVTTRFVPFLLPGLNYSLLVLIRTQLHGPAGSGYALLGKAGG